MQVKHVSKMINGKEVLSNINFTLKTGNIVGIVGRNGAGKTTLLRTLVGILDPTEGDVLLHNESIYKNPKLKEEIIFVPDSSEAMKTYSTKEIVRLYKNIYPSFDEAYFTKLMERFSLPYVKRLSQYSKGMKALFALVVAFSTKAKYILLDEPTDGLDVIVKRRILKTLVEEVATNDVSVIISSHRLDELEFMANDIIMIKDGKIESHYELDELKNQYKKAQIVFTEHMPDDVKNEVKIIQQTGRVYTIIFEMENERVSKLLEKYKPILYEELPITLEDLFVAKLGGDDIVS